MRRRHVMPFGAAPDPDGVRFRLWAPEASEIALELLPPGANSGRFPMARDAEGWFEMHVAGVRAGCRYRFRIDDCAEVPDPASRHQPDDVHGASEVIDPEAYAWRENGWCGRPWDEIVLYELHVGAFTPEGTFAGAAERLPYLRELGVTAVELMPVADFPGRRNWGYDGVLPFAPECRYGRPEALKRFVDTAHVLGLAVLLDVVYNHFGPDGNYLYLYARRSYFSQRHRTPWGAGINFDGAGSRVVRDYYIHNALYWLEEFQLDGLRFDAVHAICDDSDKHILTEIAEAVRAGPGAERHIHLVLENDDNAARYLAREGGGFDAQWNDDAHHALHVILTGERDGYYADYAQAPERHLGRALTEGYAYQGEHSPFRSRRRGEPSRHLPPSAFVDFLQNHDQIGNRALGERIGALAAPEALRAGYALLLLAPSIPLIFMGEEFGCTQPFPFFCDFEGDLARAVTDGRRREFAAFLRFRDFDLGAIPDPNAAETFASAVLDWTALRAPTPQAWHAFFTALFNVRHKEIVPRLQRIAPGRARYAVSGAGALRLEWPLTDGTRLLALANLRDEPTAIEPVPGNPFHAIPDGVMTSVAARSLPRWSVVWSST